jgi:hypothetical protein
MRSLSGIVLVVALTLAGCKDDPPKSTRWDQAASAAAASAQAAASAAASTPPPPKTETGSFNAFFPKDEGDVKLVYTADRPGYAEAKLVGADAGVVATLVVADADEAAKAKFASSKEKVADYPLVTLGKNQSALLVGTRQVKVTSPTLDAPARRTWLEKFDLAKIAALPPPPPSAAASAPNP